MNNTKTVFRFMEHSVRAQVCFLPLDSDLALAGYVPATINGFRSLEINTLWFLRATGAVNLWPLGFLS